MNVLIVENEKPAADKLIKLLKKIDPDVHLNGILETVEGTINYLKKNTLQDLIIMDIQLDDGLCFEIFDAIQVETPVIFTTAYDEFMLKAFKVNSVDYLLKPIEEEPLQKAIQKFKSIHYSRPFQNNLIKGLFNELASTYKNRFLVKIGENFRSIPVKDIGCFYILERSTFIRTFADSDYAVDYSLDSIQKTLDPSVFFRINRDCLINIHAINDIISYSSSRLKIKMNSHKGIGDLIVSRDKVNEFKIWVGK